MNRNGWGTTKLDLPEREPYRSYAATMHTIARVYDIGQAFLRASKYGWMTKKERKLMRKLGRTSLPWRA